MKAKKIILWMIVTWLTSATFSSAYAVTQENNTNANNWEKYEKMKMWKHMWEHKWKWCKHIMNMLTEDEKTKVEVIKIIDKVIVVKPIK